MRVNVAVLASEQPRHHPFTVPVTVQIRPSRGVSGEHLYTTDVHTLLSMLKRNTELSGCVLDSFMTQLKSVSSARLLGVELNDRTLREIGYFVD
ncbi:MAG: hypothetical protein ACRYFU_05930 [Janthinobacterium lividum]